MPPLLESGVIKYKESMIEGFDNVPKAYSMLFTGENIGKMVVKI